MVKLQPLKSKKGEVVFRRKLYKDFLSGKKSLVSRQLKEAIKGTKRHQKNARKAFKKLAKEKIPLSPYLDLGAASCARSMILENELNAQGVALDLSFEALKFSPLLAKGLNYKKLPLRIVCDLYHLPFQDNSFPFVFAFQTLHHLPDPRPAFLEIKRVMASSGYFYLGEEPVKQTFNLNLWRRGAKKTLPEKILMAAGLLPFITKIGKEEVKYGILEESFSLKDWQKFLKTFPQAQVEIIPFKFGGPVDTFNLPASTKALIFLLGGGINALCQVKKKTKQKNFKTILETLACPDCPSRPPLKPSKKEFSCSKCSQKYKIKDDIIFLLPKNLERQLYGKL